MSYTVWLKWIRLKVKKKLKKWKEKRFHAYRFILESYRFAALYVYLFRRIRRGPDVIRVSLVFIKIGRFEAAGQGDACRQWPCNRVLLHKCALSMRISSREQRRRISRFAFQHTFVKYNIARQLVAQQRPCHPISTLIKVTVAWPALNWSLQQLLRAPIRIKWKRESEKLIDIYCRRFWTCLTRQNLSNQISPFFEINNNLDADSINVKVALLNFCSPWRGVNVSKEIAYHHIET